MTSVRVPGSLSAMGYLGCFTPATLPLASNYPLQFVFIEKTAGSSLGDFYYSDGVRWVSATGLAFAWRDTALTSETLGTSDLNNGINFTAGSAVTLTIPNDSVLTTAQDGDSVLLLQSGAAQVSVAAGAGTTLLVRTALGGSKTAGQYAIATLIKKGASTWVLCGDISG
jgi:hypothetical protein